MRGRRLHLRMIRLIGLLIPARLRDDWRREWEAEFTALERQGADAPDALARRSLFRHSLGAWRDAFTLQRRRLEDGLAHDVRGAARALLNVPVFSIAAVLSLAVGIGATTAVFAVLNAVLLQPLPYPEADRLVLLRTNFGSYVSAPAFRRLQQHDGVFDHIAAIEGGDLVLTSGDFPELVRGHRMTSAMPVLLGLDTSSPPIRGRAIGPQDFRDGAEPVAMLSHRGWVSRFRSMDVVGRVVGLDAVPTRIVGVLPPGIDLFGESEFLLPLRWEGPEAYAETRRTLEVFGRLAEGVDSAAAALRLRGVFETLRPRQQGRIELVRDHVTHAWRATLGVLWLITLSVLLVCCLNFAGLIASRTAARRDELAVRVALGATRGRLIRQLLTESVLLSVVAAACGLLIARLGRDALIATMSARAIRSIDAPFDWLVAGFAAALAIAIGLRFSVTPARRAAAGTDVVRALRSGPTMGTVRGSRRPANLLTGTVQVAVTMALLASVGVLLKSVWRVQSFDTGYALDDAVIVRYDLPSSRYATGAEVAAFVDRLLAGVNGLPGVRSAAASSALPVGSAGIQLRPFTMDIEPPYTLGPPDPMPPGWPAPPPPPPPGSGGAGGPAVNFHQALSADVSPGYFSAVGVPVLAGREFDGRDTAAGEPVVVVNEAMVRRYWADRSPIGQRIRLGFRGPWLTVIGVVGNVNRFAQDDRPRSEYYRPLAQARDWLPAGAPFGPRAHTAFVVIRSTTPLPHVISAVAPVVFAIDPTLPATRTSTLEEELDAGTAQRRAVLRLFVVLALIALVVAATGIYGLTSYFVRQQLRALSIRAALGATDGHLVWLAMRDNLAFLVVGVPAGVLATGALVPQLQRFVADVTRWDWVVLGAITAVLTVVLATASWLAARHGCRADPVTLLKAG